MLLILFKRSLITSQISVLKRQLLFLLLLSSSLQLRWEEKEKPVSSWRIINSRGRIMHAHSARIFRWEADASECHRFYVSTQRKNRGASPSNLNRRNDEDGMAWHSPGQKRGGKMNTIHQKHWIAEDGFLHPSVGRGDKNVLASLWHELGGGEEGEKGGGEWFPNFSSLVLFCFSLVLSSEEEPQDKDEKRRRGCRKKENKNNIEEKRPRQEKGGGDWTGRQKAQSIFFFFFFFSQSISEWGRVFWNTHCNSFCSTLDLACKLRPKSFFFLLSFFLVVVVLFNRDKPCLPSCLPLSSRRRPFCGLSCA